MDRALPSMGIALYALLRYNIPNSIAAQAAEMKVRNALWNAQKNSCFRKR